MKGMKRAGEFTEVFPREEEQTQHHDFSDVVATISKDIGVRDVIDFGCGDGSLCRTFTKESYLGLDIDTKIIESARSKFSEYAFKVPSSDIYSTDMFMACRVLSELTDESIHKVMKNVRCKWLLVAEPLSKQGPEGNIFSLHQRDLENYKKIMRAHDLLLFQHKIKSACTGNPQDISFLLFKRCGRNPSL